MRDRTARRLSKLHTAAYRLTAGRIGRRLVANDMLLVTTKGRHSGRRHTVPLLYLPDGSGVVVIASWGGRDYPPHWYLNMKADPTVSVQVNNTRWKATATELGEPERSHWWSRAVGAYGGYAEYQSRTDRVIPILKLIPVLSQ